MSKATKTSKRTTTRPEEVEVPSKKTLLADPTVHSTIDLTAEESTIRSAALVTDIDTSMPPPPRPITTTTKPPRLTSDVSVPRPGTPRPPPASIRSVPTAASAIIPAPPPNSAYEPLPNGAGHQYDILKTYHLSDERILEVRHYHGEAEPVICLINTVHFRTVQFTPSRWAELCLQCATIAQKVQHLYTDEKVRYRYHLGGGYCVNVSSGVFCIDIRKFFLPKNSSSPKPTRVGCALRPYEFDQLLSQLRHINDEFPTLGMSKPCWADKDFAHYYLEKDSECEECFPFGDKPGMDELYSQ